jgi:hypothetical protein
MLRCVSTLSMKHTIVHLDGGDGGGARRGGVVDEGAREDPTCPPRPKVSPRQDPQHDDGGVACREARTWSPWSACCPRGALLGAVRPDASELPTAPVFCNKRNPSYTSQITVNLTFILRLDYLMMR